MRLSRCSVLLGGGTLGVIAIDANPQNPIQDYATKGCAAACDDLAASYPQRLLVRNTTVYDEFLAGYWSRQQQLISPLCAFLPIDASEVAVFIRLAEQTECPFAVKSGGHGTGASTIQDGISVSLENLNEITVAADRSTVGLGPGNTWSKVYGTLEPQGIAVAGGRYPSVGVGGLILGGGISFFSATKGWTCNTVVEYELVNAAGQILNVNKDSDPDLFWALCGAGSNFGIVTKFTMEAFPLPGGKIWGGLRISTEAEIPGLLQAAYNFGTKGVELDPHGAYILNVALVDGQKLGITILSHTNPPGTDEAPAVMSEFMAIPSFQSTTRLQTMNSLITEMSAGDAGPLHRRKRSTATFRLDMEVLTYAKDTCFEEFEKLADLAGLLSICVFQVITKQQLEVSAQKGGNPFGLDSKNGPLLLLNTWFTWMDDAGDARVEQAARNVVERTVAFSKGSKRDVSYRYLNYAGEFQHVISGYGAETTEKLTTLAAKYDPKRVFRALRPGIFALDRAPLV